MDYWRQLGPLLRRALKYVCEATVQLGAIPPTFPSQGDLGSRIGKIWHYAEQLVLWAELSDQTFMIASNNTQLRIEPRESEDVLIHSLRDHSDSFFKRFSKSTRCSDTYLEFPTFEYDVDEHAKVLDEEFSRQFTLTYKDAFAMFSSLIENMPSEGDGIDVPVVEKSRVLDQIVKNLSTTKERAKKIVDGFSVDKRRMDNEGRTILKPSQEYRMFRRGFLQAYDGRRPWLLWSREMAKESLLRLSSGFCFQNAPSEWQSGRLQLALSKLSNKYGRWFENEVSSQLEKLGISGVVGRSSLGKVDSLVSIPNSVGEIDFLGFSTATRSLVVLECKAVWPSSQSKLYRNDLVEFLKGDDSYVAKFQRKVDWVRDHANEIEKALLHELPAVEITNGRVRSIFHAIVTRHPLYVENAPCGMPMLSLVELCDLVSKPSDWSSESGFLSL